MTTATGTERAPSTTDSPSHSGEAARALLFDVDVHPVYLPRDIVPRLPERWREYYASTRSGRRGSAARDYPRWRNGGFRIDAAVPGGAPGSDLGVLRAQLLDEYHTDVAVLIPLTFTLEGPAQYRAALCRAINDWVAEEWLDNEPRLRASLNVPFDSPEFAATEIERFADDPRFVQVMLRGDAESEWGDAKYWPIYRAAEAADMPMMCHVGGEPSNNYIGSGPPSFYFEQHVWLHMPMERLAMSLIFSGVFDEFPSLQVALVEACISWAGPLQWALDTAYEQTKSLAHHLEEAPSAIFRRHFWMSTQPIEEPDDPRQLVQAIEFTQMSDRIMFSSDYPHWDFDSPVKALPVTIAGELREQITRSNAARLYERRMGRG